MGLGMADLASIAGALSVRNKELKCPCSLRIPNSLLPARASVLMTYGINVTACVLLARASSDLGWR